MAFLNPTTNAYRRITPEALVPTCCNWGHDNRFVLARVPGERGKACRVELRLGDGAANPYLASAATLFAGLDGIRRELEPPEPLAGLIYELPEEQLGAPLPTTLDEALAALEADGTLVEAMGADADGDVPREQALRARPRAQGRHGLGVRGVRTGAVSVASMPRTSLVLVAQHRTSA